MVMNKATKSKTKAPVKKAAVSKKATKLPTNNGNGDMEEPQDEIETNVVSENNGEDMDAAGNSSEPNLSNGNHPVSNGGNSKSVETVKTQKKTNSKKEAVTKDEENKKEPPKARGRPKKEKETKMAVTEEVPEVETLSKSDAEPIKPVKSRKRKAAAEPEIAEPEEKEEAVAGPSQPGRPRTKKKAAESSSKTPDATTQTKEKRAVPAPKTKAKRQKIVLEVPPVRAVSGTVFVMGENDVGQLGLQDVELKKRPAKLDLPHKFVDIAAGGMHSVCLTESGEVITFGCNDEGALGRLTPDDSLEGKPLRVEIPEKIVQISAGDSHSAALSETGHVYLWGNFRSGDGPMGLTVEGVKQTTPIRILNEVTIVKISSGTEHLACLSNEGVIYTVGCGENGQLGRIPRHSCQNGGRKGKASLLVPAPVHIGNKPVPIDDVWAGSYNTYMKAKDTGSIYAFGLNNYQQLGCERVNEEDNSKYVPKKISSFSNNTWIQITGGQHHSLALDKEGLVYSLGRADYGRLGLGEGAEERSVPTVIPSLQNEKCSEISCGNCVSFGVTEAGDVFSWGMGDNNQLGHGNEDDCHTPTRIEGNFFNSWKAHKVSGGGQHTLILAVPKEDPNK